MKFVMWYPYHLEAEEIVADYIQRLKKILHGHDFTVCYERDCIEREVEDANVLIGWKIDKHILSKAKKLKWIQFGSAGIDHTMFPELEASDVIITTLGGIHSTVVPEHVIGLMLALARRFDVAMHLQMNHKYDREELKSTSIELSGLTLGIIGLGRIGLGIAKLAKAFDMKVIGTKRKMDGALPNVDEIYPADQYHNVLKVSDFIVIVVPLTNQTNALIGEREIDMMKHCAHIINVARGAMLDHDALGKALKEGKLRGAALDVFPEEPLPPDSQLYDLPNLIITPHTSASTGKYAERGATIFKTNLNAFITGKEMINVYDRKKGY